VHADYFDGGRREEPTQHVVSDLCVHGMTFEPEIGISARVICYGLSNRREIQSRVRALSDHALDHIPVGTKARVKFAIVSRGEFELYVGDSARQSCVTLDHQTISVGAVVDVHQCHCGVFVDSLFHGEQILFGGFFIIAAIVVIVAQSQVNIVALQLCQIAHRVVNFFHFPPPPRRFLILECAKKDYVLSICLHYFK
jgi:hypothetical protein